MHLPPKVQKWVDALRSGEFKQGKSALRTKDDKYCCLGVLTELYRQEHPEVLTWQESRAIYIAKAQSGSHAAYLLHEVRSWLGGMKSGVMFELAGLNDNGTSFDLIAERIEQMAKSGQIGQDASS